MLGPDESRLKAELDFSGRHITARYLHDKDLHAMLKSMQTMNEDELRAHLMELGEGIIDQLGTEIDRLESNIKQADPRIRHIDLEAL
jgi:zinc transporter 9